MKANKSSIPPAIGWTCLALSMLILLISTVLLAHGLVSGPVLVVVGCVLLALGLLAFGATRS